MPVSDLRKYIEENKPLHGLLTGTFDPPHKGHVEAIAIASRETADLDHVVVIPHNWNKRKTPVDLKKRVDWLIKTLHEFKLPTSPQIIVCTDEDITNDPSRLDSICASFEQRLVRIIGNDKNPKKLQARNSATQIITPRNQEIRGSAIIRRAIAEGRINDISHLLSTHVLQEIIKGNYYK